ncbi:hypothetical protein AB205_0083630 [Aquarana catesbeiana]|uniref:MADF domain-containing protein n=1 Tax=Aquarana catesbeiana TaxID=8400 RepID=A0A2G9RUP6_AQUCT|nr:hypothetical protein AB205_0083630 [Aquarana catesbeiana]
MSVSRREVVHREPIDNECLIRLVRQRPCLYDEDYPTYRDQIKKDNAWLQICRGSFEDWDMMTNSQHSEKHRMKSRTSGNIAKSWCMPCRVTIFIVYHMTYDFSGPDRMKSRTSGNIAKSWCMPCRVTIFIV